MPDLQQLFLPANFFLVRVASFPIDSLFALFEEQNPSQKLVEKWLSDPFFRQAIAFSSQSLSSQIRKGKMNESAILSLFKYFSRICSRGTPYGLLSFVTWGQAAHQAHSELDWGSLSKRARPDMGWVQKYIEIIIQDDSEFLDLEIQKNPIITEQNGRYSTAYFIDKTDRLAASIKKNELTSLIFSRSGSPLKVKELISLIQSHFPRTPTDRVVNVVRSLLEQQFLWHTLHPKLNTSSPFLELIQKAPEKYKEELCYFQNKIRNYSLMNHEDGEKYLYELSDEMSKKGTNVRLPIQVDLGISSKPLELPQQVLENVANGGEILWKLSTLNQKPPLLKNYHSEFLEKYGQQRIVPLLDLLDPNKGLGVPNYDSPPTEKLPESDEAIQTQDWIKDALSKAQWNRQDEIVIEDDFLLQIGQKVDKKQAPPSIDLFFEVYATSTEDVNSGNYQIYINNLVNIGGATFGRFLDYLDPEVTERLKQFYAHESNLEKDTKIVDSFYLPLNSNTQNVAISPSLRSHTIDLSPGSPPLLEELIQTEGAAQDRNPCRAPKQSLNLDQIYVGATSNFIYLTNAIGEVEFRVTSTNVLVDTQAPEALRFIREVSRERFHRIELWSWGSASISTYLPRVRYKNIILSAAKWWTTLPLIGAKQNQSLEEITNKLSNWADQFDLPEYVYITEGDNKLLINRRQKEHITIAAAYLKRSKKIIFSEKIGQKKGHWVESSRGKHCAEFVLPLRRNPFYAKKNREIPQISFRNYQISDRLKLPGSEWLYYKFYLTPKSHYSFLRDHLYDFAEQLVEDNLVQQWFFIRYHENEQHQIRFRMKITSPNFLSTVFNLTHQFSQKLLETSLIQDVNICTYEREIERYGGSQLIDLCEEFFSLDSSLAIELLEFESPQLPIHVIGTLSILDLLTHLDFDATTLQNFFNYLRLDKKELIGYREWKKTIESGFVKTFGSIGEKRALALRMIMDRMKDPSLNPSTSIFSLAASLIHMHCNRLCGTDLSIENKTKVFAAHYTESSLSRDLLKNAKT